MRAYAQIYLCHRLFGDCPNPNSSLEFQHHLSGTRIFKKGGFVVHRTPEKFVSFCWVNQLMGLVYPADDTWFISPQERGLIGGIEVSGAKDTPPVLENHAVKKLEVPRGSSNDGFSFVAKLARCEGKIEQRIAFISLPNNPVLYVEQLKAREHIEVNEIATETVSILNEDAAPIIPNERRIWTEQGEHRIPGVTDASPSRHVWDTGWVNLDDKLSVAAHAKGQMMYLANHKYRRARVTQTLAANYASNLGIFEPGEFISEAVVELLPNATHTNRIELKVEEPLSHTYLIRVEEYWVLVNLGEKTRQPRVSGVRYELPGLSVIVGHPRPAKRTRPPTS